MSQHAPKNIILRAYSLTSMHHHKFFSKRISINMPTRMKVRNYVVGTLHITCIWTKYIMQYYVVSKATSSKNSKKFKATKINPTLDSLKLMDPPPVHLPPTFAFNKDFNGRSIQHKWFADRNWLEYDSGLLFCSVCHQYSNQLPGWNSIMSKS